MVSWKNIHSDFNIKLQKEWRSKGFSYEETEKWIKVGKLEPTEADFAQWIRDVKKLGSRNILNKDFLKKEYYSENKIIDEREETNKPKKRIRIGSNKENFQKELFEAIESDNIEKAIKIIEKEELDINDTYGEDKFTPLHLAVAHNQKETVTRLLGSRANPNAKDSEGNTPLHFAAEQNNLEMLRLLIDNGGNVNEINEYNWSILHSAASGIINEKEDWEVIKLLLEKKAKTNVKADNGFTARKVFLQKDYSYAEIYDKLVDRSNLERESLGRQLRSQYIQK